jgi:oligopeptidase B
MKKNPFPDVAPPKAEQRPHAETWHNITRIDEYAWLRAENWRDVFKDPSKLDHAIRAHLEAENEYQKTLMADTTELQKTLFQEMKGRIKEDDSSVPMKDGPYAYGTSYKVGGEHPRFFRTPRDGGAEEIVLDGDREAEGKAYFRIGDVEHSSDHRRLLWSYDDKGSELFSLRVRELDGGADLDDVVSDTGGSGVWSASNEGVFYARLDANHRPSKIFFHEIGTESSADHLVYEESDPGFFMNVGGTRRNDWIMISINDHETSEYRLLPANDPLTVPKVVEPREKGLKYDLEEGGDVFFILTNADGAKDFKIVTASVSDPARANWKEFVPHEPGRLILSVLAFKDYLVRLERKDGLPRIVIRERTTGEEHMISFDEEAFSLGLAGDLRI